MYSCVVFSHNCQQLLPYESPFTPKGYLFYYILGAAVGVIPYSCLSDNAVNPPLKLTLLLLLSSILLLTFLGKLNP